MDNPLITGQNRYNSFKYLHVFMLITQIMQIIVNATFLINTLRTEAEILRKMI